MNLTCESLSVYRYSSITLRRDASLRRRPCLALPRQFCDGLGLQDPQRYASILRQRRSHHKINRLKKYCLTSSTTTEQYQQEVGVRFEASIHCTWSNRSTWPLPRFEHTCKVCHIKDLSISHAENYSVTDTSTAPASSRHRKW